MAALFGLVVAVLLVWGVRRAWVRAHNLPVGGGRHWAYDSGTSFADSGSGDSPASSDSGASCDSGGDSGGGDCGGGD